MKSLIIKRIHMFDNYVYCASTMKVEGILVDVAECESEIEKKV